MHTRDTGPYARIHAHKYIPTYMHAQTTPLIIPYIMEPVFHHVDM